MVVTQGRPCLVNNSGVAALKFVFERWEIMNRERWMMTRCQTGTRRSEREMSTKATLMIRFVSFFAFSYISTPGLYNHPPIPYITHTSPLMFTHMTEEPWKLSL